MVPLPRTIITRLEHLHCSTSKIILEVNHVELMQDQVNLPRSTKEGAVVVESITRCVKLVIRFKMKRKIPPNILEKEGTIKSSTDGDGKVLHLAQIRDKAHINPLLSRLR